MIPLVEGGVLFLVRMEYELGAVVFSGLAGDEGVGGLLGGLLVGLLAGLLLEVKVVP